MSWAWRSRLLTDASFVLTGQLASSCFLILISFVLARTLGLEGFGIFGTLTAIISLTTDMSELGLGGTLVREVNRHAADVPRCQFTLLLALGLYTLAALAILVLGFLLAPVLARTLLPAGSATETFLVRIAFTVAAASVAGGYVGAVLRAHQRFGKLALWSVLPTASRALLIGAAALLYPGQVAVALGGYLCAAAIAASVGLTAAVRKYVTLAAWKYRQRWTVSLEFLGFTKWLAASVLLGTLATRLAPLMLAGRSIPENVALYTAANQLALLAPMGINTMNTILLPAVNRVGSAADCRHYLWRAYCLAGVLAVAIAVSFAVSPFIFSTLFGHRFAAASGVFRVVMLAYLVSLAAWPVILLLYPLSRPDLITKVTFLQVAIQIPVTYFLIPGLGVYAPALTFLTVTVLGTVLLCLSVQVLCKRAASGGPGWQDCAR